MLIICEECLKPLGYFNRLTNYHGVSKCECCNNRIGYNNTVTIETIMLPNIEVLKDLLNIKVYDCSMGNYYLKYNKFSSYAYITVDDNEKSLEYFNFLQTIDILIVRSVKLENNKLRIMFDNFRDDHDIYSFTENKSGMLRRIYNETITKYNKKKRIIK